MKPWYESLFANYARHYDQESFTQGTLGECDFLEREIASNRSRRILDIGCGTGRHAIELSRRGYSVTGVDLSEAQLARAREKAAALGVSVEWDEQEHRAVCRRDGRTLDLSDANMKLEGLGFFLFLFF